MGSGGLPELVLSLNYAVCATTPCVLAFSSSSMGIIKVAAAQQRLDQKLLLVLNNSSRRTCLSIGFCRSAAAAAPEAASVAEAVQNFITVMDSLKLNLVAIDQVRDALVALFRVGASWGSACLKCILGGRQALCIIELDPTRFVLPVKENACLLVPDESAKFLLCRQAVGGCAGWCNLFSFSPNSI